MKTNRIVQKQKSIVITCQSECEIKSIITVLGYHQFIPRLSHNFNYFPQFYFIDLLFSYATIEIFSRSILNDYTVFYVEPKHCSLFHHDVGHICESSFVFSGVVQPPPHKPGQFKQGILHTTHDLFFVGV